DQSDAQADAQVPSAQSGDRIQRSGDVVHQHPGEPEQHETDHDGLEPDRVRGGFAFGALDGLFGYARSCHAISLAGEIRLALMPDAAPTRRARRERQRPRATFVSVLGELLLTAGVLVLLFVSWQMWVG